MFRRREPLTTTGRLFRLLWPSMGLVRSGRYIAHRVGRIQGTPHAHALGIACGVALSMTPLIGLHIPMAFVLAWAFRASVASAMFATIVANPWTFPAIWYASYRLGCWMLGIDPGAGNQTELTLTFLLEHPWQIFWPMLTGGSLMGVIFAALAYAIAKPIIQFYQEKQQHRRRAAIAQREGNQR